MTTARVPAASARSRPPSHVRPTDAVIIGAGAAGLVAALRLAPLRVTVLTKATTGTGGATPLAQGGLAAAVGPDDDTGQHAADTVAVAGQLADLAVVEEVTTAAPAVVRALTTSGVRFDTAPDGSLLLGREAGHSQRRILHAHDDATGAELTRALWAAVGACPTVELMRQATAVRLVAGRAGVGGVLVRHADGAHVVHTAPAVVLATGGIGSLYAKTTNPPEATGDGLALAARAGARLADLEFVQFHPTALAAAGDHRLPLLSEALRGEGARITDAAGRPLLEGVHPDGDLAPRDVIARAVWAHHQAGEPVFLDARAVFARHGSFPTVRGLCAQRGLDPAVELLPVTAAAHYHMGGVAVDGRGRSSLPGLWACGEVACSGMHGANRLASNSLLEAIVMGARVAADIRRQTPGPAPVPGASDLEPTPAATTAASDGTSPSAPDVMGTVRGIMWDQVGLVRDRAGLAEAMARFDELTAQLGPGEGEAHNMLLVARLVATAGLHRRESRGAHFRRDYPRMDPSWLAHQWLSLGASGAIEVQRTPITAADVA